jgi:hypothetical protein
LRQVTWLYFIFGVCQWLPTNHRVYYADNSSTGRTKCKLCLMDTEEDLAHVFECPALASEHSSLLFSASEKLKEWDVPWAQGRIETLANRMCRSWVQRAQEIFKESIAKDRLMILARDFWKTNNTKETISWKSFIANLRTLIARSPYQCNSLPQSLLQVLTTRLGLHVEAKTHSLHRSALFSQWFSDDAADLAFGAEGAMMENSLSGKNSLLLYLEEDKEEFVQIYLRILDQISSKNPTRFMLVTHTHFVAEIPPRHRRAFLEIARFPLEFPSIPPGSYRNQMGSPSHRSAQPVSIVVVLNKESMIMDPIDWTDLKVSLRNWSDQLCPSMVIPEITDQLFRERSSVIHTLRAQKGPPPSESPIYHFFDFRLPIRNEIEQLRNRGMHEGEAKQIDKINRHNKILSVLGILPNQLRTLMKESMEDTEVALLDIRKTLFLSGYKVWKKRKLLVNRFWNKIAPEEWKVHGIKSRKKKKKNVSHCNNPFHFLKKHSDLSKQKETRCPCSVAQRANQRSLKSRDIRSFLTKFPQIHLPDTNVNASLSVSRRNIALISENRNSSDYKTRDDRIRSAHDRSKKQLDPS